LRVWDKTSAGRVDFFVANSHTVSHRIQKYYGRCSTVINPPVDIKSFSVSNEPKKYFLSGGRLVSYKRFDIIVDAFTKLGLPLKIFGVGPMMHDLKKRSGKNVEFLGRVSNVEKAKVYQDAIAFIHPQEEDFGITPIESMASGRPVIAYRRGGVLESIVENKTGVFFDEQSWERLAATVRSFDATKFNPEIIRVQAEKYSTDKFKSSFQNFVHDKYEEFKINQTHPCA
jgi:glycosyltransferase involved in cell wall biosynthesis